MGMQWDKITKEYKNIMKKIKAGINMFLDMKNERATVFWTVWYLCNDGKITQQRVQKMTHTYMLTSFMTKVPPQ